MEQITMLGLSAIVVGLVEVVKRAGLPDRVAPIAALAIGICIAFIGKTWLPTQGAADVILYGLIMGLSSMGLYSGGRAIAEK